MNPQKCCLHATRDRGIKTDVLFWACLKKNRDCILTDHDLPPTCSVFELKREKEEKNDKQTL